MPTPQQLDSLKRLMGLESNYANTAAGIRGQTVRDAYARPNSLAKGQAIATAEQFAQEQYDRDEARAAVNPMSRRYAQIAQGQNEAAVAGVPEIARMRATQLAEQERLATAPARLKGENALKVAEAEGVSRLRALSQLMQGGGMRPGQHVSVGDVSMTEPQVPRVSQSDIADRQYLGLLRAGKAHAPGYSFWSGPSQQELDQAEMAKIEARLGGEGENGDGDLSSGNTDASAPPAPAGWRYVRKPGGGWTAIESQ